MAEELNKGNLETPAPRDNETNDEGNMSLIQHLTELRQRLIRCLLAVAAGSVIAYAFIEDIMHCVTAPVGKLYYLQPSEACTS